MCYFNGRDPIVEVDVTEDESTFFGYKYLALQYVTAPAGTPKWQSRWNPELGRTEWYQATAEDFKPRWCFISPYQETRWRTNGTFHVRGDLDQGWVRGWYSRAARGIYSIKSYKGAMNMCKKWNVVVRCHLWGEVREYSSTEGYRGYNRGMAGYRSRHARITVVYLTHKFLESAAADRGFEYANGVTAEGQVIDELMTQFPGILFKRDMGRGMVALEAAIMDGELRHA